MARPSFHAGQCDLDLFVVQSGGIDIINPSDSDRHVPSSRLRELLNKVPRLSEKLLIACMERRRRNMDAGTIGVKVIGPGKCRLLRTLLEPSFVM